MLHLITGTPGSGKSLYAVYLIKKLEDDNKQNIMLNPPFFSSNQKVIDDNNLQPYFDYYTNKDDSITAVPPDFYNFLGEYHRQDDYYFRATCYNKSIIEILKDYPELKRKLKFMRDVRTIYCNISGLKVDHVRLAPDDWRTTPFGSVIFYDEIQLIEPYEEVRASNDIVDRLSVHRHTGHDIYGITQFPIQVHSKFRAVVGQHYHIVRGWGLPSAAVYVWGYAITSPNSPVRKLFAERKIRFNYPTYLYEYYNSSMIHTHKMRIPPKMIAIMVFTAIMFFVAISLLFSKDNMIFKLFTGGYTAEQPSVVDTTGVDQPQQLNQAPAPQQHQQIANVASDVPIAKEDARMRYLGAEMAAFVADEDIRPAMVVSSDLNCKAFNSKGERLLIDNTVCLLMSQDTSLIPKTRIQQQQQYQVQQPDLNQAKNTASPQEKTTT